MAARKVDFQLDDSRGNSGDIQESQQSISDRISFSHEAQGHQNLQDLSMSSDLLQFQFQQQASDTMQAGAFPVQQLRPHQHPNPHFAAAMPPDATPASVDTTGYFGSHSFHLPGSSLRGNEDQSLYHALQEIFSYQQPQQQQQQGTMPLVPLPAPSLHESNGNRGAGRDGEDRFAPSTSEAFATMRSLTEDQLMERSISEMEEFVRAMPLEVKAEFNTARENDLSNTETSYATFLRHCQFNVPEAAVRLCLYWKTRKELFGEDRAFLPLIMTGDGALTRDDTLSLRAGFPAMLPETRTGQKVVYIDSQQFIPSASTESRLRCLFYIAHVLTAEDNRTQNDDGALLWIVLVATPRLREMDLNFMKECFYLIEKVLPIRPVYHLVNRPGTSKSANRLYMLQDMIVGMIEVILEQGVPPEKICVHFEREQGELFDALMELKFSREGVPTLFGGTWTFVQAAEWCRAQASKERGLYRMDMIIALRRQADRAETSDLKTTGDEEDRKPPSQAKKDQKEKRRERNLIYSRRKRDRRKQEMANIQEECDMLAGEKEALMDERNRLLGLLQQTRHIIANLEANNSDEDTEENPSE